MAQPVLPDITESDANALAAGGAHGDTGIKYIPYQTGKNDTPKVHTRVQQQVYHLMQLLGGANQGRAYSLGGLLVGVFALKYMIGSTEYAYAGDVSFTLTASATNSLYLDTAATLKNATSGWPGGDHVKLAVVTTDATDVTAVEDSRWKNLQVGGVSNWWTFAPTAAIDLNGQDLDDAGFLGFGAAVELTISAGVITPTQTHHTVDTESDGATDDLDTITVPGAGKLLILSAADGARTVVIKNGTGNLTLKDGDLTLEDTDKFIVLLSRVSDWVEVARNFNAPTQLSGDLDCNGGDLLEVGALQFLGETLVIAAGAVTVSETRTLLFNEASAPTDDLDTISGGTTGDVLLLMAGLAAQVPTIKHNTGNIQLANGRDFTLATIEHVLVLQYDGTNWVEVSRSHWQIFDLTGTGKGLRWVESQFVSTTLTLDTTYDLRIYCPTETKIEYIAAYVATAPSGGNCVVDLLDDSVSIFASQNDNAVIADGTNSALSLTVNYTVAAGSWLTIRTHDVNAAGLLSVTIVGRRDVPAS